MQSGRRGKLGACGERREQCRTGAKQFRDLLSHQYLHIVCVCVRRRHKNIKDWLTLLTLYMYKLIKMARRIQIKNKQCYHWFTGHNE